MLSVLQSVLIVLARSRCHSPFWGVEAGMPGDGKDGTQRHYWLADQRVGHNLRGDSRVYAMECLE